MSEKRDNAALSSKLQKHVKKLSYDIGDRSSINMGNLNKAKAYIKSTLESYGYVVSTQSYTVDKDNFENLIVEKKGQKNPDEIIILGAHYDTCDNPGADDNASAVAGLLEVASFLSDKKLNKTLRFVAFVNEEPPYFKTENMGSYVYAKACKEKNENITAAVIFEMLGYYSSKPNSQKYPPFLGYFYPDIANFIAFAGNFSSSGIIKKSLKSFKKHTGFPIETLGAPSFVPGIDFSDHWSFYQFGYKAFMVTDTAYFRNHNYHQQSDLYDTLDYESMAEVVRAMGHVFIDITK